MNDFNEDFELSPEQKAVLVAFKQGKNIFFTGSAGTGKSYLLTRIIKACRASEIAVTAPTGLAAVSIWVVSLFRQALVCSSVCVVSRFSQVNVGGITIHSFAGVGYGEGLVSDLINKVKNNRTVSKRWKKTKVSFSLLSFSFLFLFNSSSFQTLIIDEISMLSPDLFDKLDAIAKAVRKSERPFGGVQLILCGDFFQLPPVTKGKVVDRFCFDARTWNT
jgi:ATP-dependent DNA helicase PIF1